MNTLPFTSFKLSQKKTLTRRPKLPTVVSAAVEIMETRQLPSASALFLPATNELSIELDDSESVQVSAVNGNVSISTSTDGVSFVPVTTIGTVPAADVFSINVLGGDEANNIDLSRISAADFTRLVSLVVDGANGDDTLTGSPDFADSLIGGNGRDTIIGNGGNDTLVGGDGNDSINGGIGDDSITGGDGNDSIQGEDGNDSINAGNGRDTVSGGIGSDTVHAGNGDDNLLGDAGDDFLNGDGGTDTVDGGDDNDSILGGEFADSLLGGNGNDTINGQSGSDDINGGDGDDSLRGGAHDDVISGNLGNDVLNGETGADQLDGGDGNDLILGGAGDDSATGNLGNDTIQGQAGDDSLVGGGGADNVQGGAGNDSVLSVEQSVGIVSTLVIVEGDSGTTNAVLTVTLGTSSANTVTVDFATQDGTAIAGSDYVATSGQLTFAPGVNSQTIVVPIIGDTVVETSESFSVVLSNPVNAPLDQATSLITITDNDVAVNQYDIQIVFSGGLTPSQQATFQAAEARWESIVIGDLPDLFVPGFGLVDDLVIDASGVAIDGPGGILGQAGPDPAFLRQGSFLPASGIMQFDTADLAALEASGELFETILHEMAHVMGFGTIWTDLNLLANPASAGGTDPRFIGTLATQEYNTRFGTNDLGVPVEANFGPGTEDSHWRQSDFGNELMIGFSTPGFSPISRITIAQFADLGYQVNFGQSDPFLRALASSSSQLANLTPMDRALSDSLDWATMRPVGSRTAILDLEGDTLSGGDGDDTIQGASGDDTISGQGGNDALSGGDGNDSLTGGAGQDTLDGQAGNDTLDGQGSDDSLIGGEGNDSFVLGNGAGGDDTAEGGAGFNQIVVNGTNNGDTIGIAQVSGTILATRGTATITATSDIFGVTVNGLGGNDTITINDLSAVVCPTLVTINGGDGNDLINGVGANLGATRLFLNGDNGNDTIVGTNGGDSINGGAGDDAVNGQAGNDSISGGVGDDILSGGLGNDSLDGGNGADFLTGQAGDDSLVGGESNDTLRGFEGNDTLIGVAGDDLLNGMEGNDSISGGVGQDQITGGSGDDSLDGGRNNDTINGNSGNDFIRGDHGHDFISAGTESDTVIGGDGNDTILATDGGDLLAGGDGDDQINAGGGNDILLGGDGNDTLLGGGGSDVLLGGDGDDTINGQGGTDTIAGNQGTDAIADSLSEIDENFVLSDVILALLAM